MNFKKPKRANNPQKMLKLKIKKRRRKRKKTKKPLLKSAMSVSMII